MIIAAKVRTKANISYPETETGNGKYSTSFGI